MGENSQVNIKIMENKTTIELFNELQDKKDLLAEIEEWAGKYIKYTDEEINELNKDLPNTLQEQALHQSDGMRKVISDLQAFIKSKRE